MIAIVISTVSHFWSPILTTWWQSGSLYLQPYFPWYILPPPTNILWGGLFFFRILQLGAGKIAIFLGPSVLGGPKFLFGRGEAIFFNKVINDQKQLMAKLSVSCVYANFSHFYLESFSLRVFCLFKSPLKLSKKCLLLFSANSENVNTV